MRICIVGGTGNISTGVVRELVRHGHDVTCFNRGKAGPPPEGAKVIVGDRSDRDAFESRMRSERFEAAIDFISFNGDTARSDVRAFEGASHFVHISTTCVYGIDYDVLPVPEDHPRRPITAYGRGKVEAEDVLTAAYDLTGFPVTLVRPSTTYGPQLGLVRQIAWDFSWLHRIRTGRPILLCDDGAARHQFLHVNDAAIGLAHMIGKDKCVGQAYNLVDRCEVTWRQYHETAMAVLGMKVDLPSISCDQLGAFGVPNHGICREIFAHDCYYSGEKAERDIPEFRPRTALADGIRQVYDEMLSSGRVPDSPVGGWEDRIVEQLGE
jgi:nucleoside-diphosphate-sugar epimerase